MSLPLWAIAHHIGEGVRDLSLLEADERGGVCPPGKRKLLCPHVLGKGVLEQGTKAFF